MEIFYCLYTVTPLKRPNRSSNLEPKQGVYLKAKTNAGVTYADYFPQSSFGDKGHEPFLAEFKFQQSNYDRKIHHFLLKDKEYQSIPQKKFFNHQLWTGTEDFESQIIKYKLPKSDDRIFLDPLKRGLKIRLDANAQFNRENFLEFFSTIPEDLKPLIDYIEDPLLDQDWSDLGVKSASDIIKGNPHYAKIHRPNSDFFPTQAPKVIFSSYLGGDLGRWHTYCELAEHGNLNEVHGILSPGFLKEETPFVTGDYFEGFVPVKEAVLNIYDELSKKEWKSLCTL